MNLACLLARAGRVFPDAPALALGERILADYRGLARTCARLGAALRARLQLAPGDRIALFMSNGPAYVELTWAAWWAGLAIVPINAKLHPKEAEYILDHSGARVCFVDADHAQAIGALAATVPGLARTIAVESDEYRALAGDPELAPAESAPDDLAWLFYTSGTTGRPKGVMLTHRNLLAMTLCYFADVDAIGHGDSIVHAAPMSHGSGIYSAAARRRGGAAGHPGERRVRAGGDLLARPGVAGHGDVRRADDGETPRRPRAPRAAGARGAEDDRLRRRPDVPRRHRGRDRGHGAALRADLRPGREPDDDHRAVATPPCRGEPSRAMRSGSLRSASRSRASRCAWPTGRTGAAARRARRDPGARRCGDEGLLAQSGGHAPRRCAAAGSTPATSAPWTRTDSSR